MALTNIASTIGVDSDVYRDNELLEQIVQALKTSGRVTYAPRDAEYVDAFGMALEVTLDTGRTAIIMVSVQ